MKKISLIFIFSFVLALISCGSVPEKEDFINEENISNYNGLIVRGISENPNELPKNRLLTITTEVTKPKYFNFSNWSKIRITSDILDCLGLNDELSNNQKFMLMSHVFDDLPMNGKDGIIREVRLGKYFKKGSGDEKNLVIRIAVFTPGKDASIPSEKIILFYTNAILGDSINKEYGQFINIDTNVGLLSAYNKGMLTNIERSLSSDLNKQDTSKMNNLEKILYSQDILLDESTSNDNIALNLSNNIINDKNEQPVIIIFAKLVKYSYYISKDDLNNAQIMWNDILEYSKLVPGDMNEENLESSNGAQIYLLKKLTNNVN